MDSSLGSLMYEDVAIIACSEHSLTFFFLVSCIGRWRLEAIIGETRVMNGEVFEATSWPMLLDAIVIHYALKVRRKSWWLVWKGEIPWSLFASDVMSRLTYRCTYFIHEASYGLIGWLVQFDDLPAASSGPCWLNPYYHRPARRLNNTLQIVSANSIISQVYTKVSVGK